MNGRSPGLTAIQYDCIAAAFGPFLREVAPHIVSRLRRQADTDRRHVNRVRLAAERFRRTPIGARPSIVRSSFLRPPPAIDVIELIVGVQLKPAGREPGGLESSDS
jgi:hypothetical protein